MNAESTHLDTEPRSSNDISNNRIIVFFGFSSINLYRLTQIFKTRDDKSYCLDENTFFSVNVKRPHLILLREEDGSVTNKPLLKHVIFFLTSRTPTTLT